MSVLDFGLIKIKANGGRACTSQRANVHLEYIHHQLMRQ